MRHAVRSEWQKLMTSRAVIVSMLVAGALTILLGAQRAHSIETARRLPANLDVLGASLFGLSVGQFAVIAAGVLAITGEYASGTIFASLLATPQRGRLLAAKIVVVGAGAFAFGLVLAVASYVLGQALMGSAHVHAAPFGLVALRRLAGAGAEFAAIALVGFAIGTLLRRTAGALAATGALFILPVTLLNPIDASTRREISGVLPLRAADALVGLHASATSLNALPAFAWVLAEVGALLAAATLAFRRRDA